MTIDPPGRSRWGRWVWALTGVVSAVSSFLCSGAWYGLKSVGSVLFGERCTVVERVDLDMAELADLRARTSVYRRDPSDPLVLSPRELTWVLSEQYHTPVWVEAEGRRARVSRPLRLDASSCVDVRFEGRVTIRDGDMELRPDVLVVDGWDLPVEGAKFELRVDDIEEDEPELVRLLQAVDRLDVRGGRFVVELSDSEVLP